jgi:hypothetical protein
MLNLCFMVPDTSSAESVLNDIRMLGVDDERIHAIANDQTQVEELPNADVMQENDVLGGAARGAVAGSATGMLAGLFVALVPGAGIVTAATALAAGAVGGAGFGVWIGTIVGAAVPNSQLDDWRTGIDAGQILIIVEVEEHEAAGVRKVLEASQYSVLAVGEKAHIPLL